MAEIEQITDSVHLPPPAPAGAAPRGGRTVKAIDGAFSKLFFAKGFDGFGIIDICEEADVARSTFYKHYSSKDDVLCRILRPMLLPFANIPVSAPISGELKPIVEHFWSNRQLARTIFATSSKAAVVRLLSSLMLEAIRPTNLDPHTKISVQCLAQFELSFIEEWLSGRYSYSSEQLVSSLHQATRAAAAALLGDRDLSSRE